MRQNVVNAGFLKNSNIYVCIFCFRITSNSISIYIAITQICFEASSSVNFLQSAACKSINRFWVGLELDFNLHLTIKFAQNKVTVWLFRKFSVKIRSINRVRSVRYFRNYREVNLNLVRIYLHLRPQIRFSKPGRKFSKPCGAIIGDWRNQKFCGKKLILIFKFFEFLQKFPQKSSKFSENTNVILVSDNF